MNKARRTALNAIFARLDAIQKEVAPILGPYVVEIGELRDELDTLKDEEQEFFDEKSEKWQEGDKGTEVEGFIQNMQDAYSEIDEVFSALEDFADEEEGFFKNALEALDAATYEKDD